MGIQGALYSGVSGMTVNSTSMEVIGNTIANSNTYGYKTSRTVFSDALNNAVSSSSGVAQVGSGAMLSSVDSVFGQGTFESTTSNTDLAIQGDGFFMVKDSDSGKMNYTRAGAFRVQNGALTNPEGLVVQGYTFPNGGALTDIAVEIGSTLPGWTPSTELQQQATTLRGLADADAAVQSAILSSVNALTDPTAADVVGVVSGATDVTASMSAAAAAAGAVGGATADDVLAAVAAVVASSEQEAAAAEELALRPAPKLESVSVDKDGIVTGKYTDGTAVDMYTIGIAKFNNPSGLTKEGNSMYSASSVSGEPVMGIVSEIGGTIYSSTLEMSNVDLAQEFVKMITTQRGFQASSKIITTTDELLNEVINLKR